MGEGGRRGSEGGVTTGKWSEEGNVGREGEVGPRAKERRWPPEAEKATEADSPIECSPVRPVLDFSPSKL